MGRVPATMYQTISVADRLRRSGCPAAARCQAVELLQALAAVEYHASAGRPAPVPPALLRDLVIITGRLAGRTWLTAHADTMAGFAALHSMTEPPPLAELDQVLARVLSERFAAALTEGSGSLEHRSPLRPGSGQTERRPVMGRVPSSAPSADVTGSTRPPRWSSR